MFCATKRAAISKVPLYLKERTSPACNGNFMNAKPTLLQCTAEIANVPESVACSNMRTKSMFTYSTVSRHLFCSSIQLC